MTAIGKTSSTRNDPNTSEKFSFWLEDDDKVNPTDIIATENADDSKTFGLVTQIENRSDSESHLDNFVSHDFGDAAANPLTQRLSTNVAMCEVLKNTKDNHMPVVAGQDVAFANEKDILTALGVGDVEQSDPNFLSLPVGIIEQSNDSRCPAIIDGRYLLGPDGAHFNISGISGLAAKTSYAMFLLNVLLQKRKDEAAVIIFNVKHNDLLYIDQPADIEIQDDQKKLWDVLDVNPQEFKNVEYFLPRGMKGAKIDPNSQAPLPPNYSMYAYNLERMKGKLSYLFDDVADPYSTIQPIIEDLTEDLERSPTIYRGSGRSAQSYTVREFDDLLRPDGAFGSNASGNYHHTTSNSVRKFARLLRYFVQTGTSGVFLPDRPAPNEVNLADYIRAIQPNQVYVIDIAQMKDFEQAFVVGDVINEVKNLFSRQFIYRDIPLEIRKKAWGQDVENHLGDTIEPPKNVIFFVDELNKYAPSGRSESSPILREMIEITSRGRSAGLILLGAEQFASHINHHVFGNSSNKVYGRSDSTELSNQAYRDIPSDLKPLIARLPQGKLLLQHPLYRQPVQISFPKPVYKQPGP